MTIDCVIIEDEIAGQVILSKKLEFFPECNICGIFDNKEDAVVFLSENEVDIVFIDVHLKGGSGIDVIRELENRAFESIFITAHKDYAIEALNNNYASYYLLKPIHDADLKKAMTAVLQKVKKRKEVSVIFVSHKNMQYAISIDDVLYFQSEGTYTHIFTKDGQYLSSKNIGYFENVLSAEQFFRIHHSYLINIVKAKELIKYRGGIVIMENGVQLPVSQRKLSSFVKLIASRKSSL